MKLGSFSVSLAVKDLTVSRTFYERLGFQVFAGEAEQGWLILKNGDAVIGLFQGMFGKNILTFNPGWDAYAQPLDDFTDVRELQKLLNDKGFTFESEADETTPAEKAASHWLATVNSGRPAHRCGVDTLKALAARSSAR